MQAIGNYLREVREKRGLSQAAVEEGCKIPMRYIQAIESGDFSLLPGRAYAIGFIRTYAKFLQVDSDELVEYYKEKYPEEEPVAYAPEYHEAPVDVEYDGQPIHMGYDQAASAKPFNLKGLITIVIIAAVVVVILFAVGVFGGAKQPTNTVQPAAPVAENSGADTTEPATTPETPGAAQAAPLTVTVSATKGDCDLAVTTDQDPEPLNISLLQGQQISFESTEYVDITYSNAGAVDVTVNGEAWEAPGADGDEASVEYNVNKLQQ